MDLESLYRDIVEGSSDGIWVFDLSGATIYANPALARMFGVTQQELMSLTVFDSLDDVGREQFADHLRDLRQGRFTDRDVECVFVRRNGSRLWILVGETLLRGPDGDIIAVLHRLSDYDERRALVDRLTASEQALAESQELARLGSWTWDVVADEIRGSESLYRLYGVQDPQRPVPYADFLARVHHQDQAEVEAELARVLAEGGEFAFVARVRSGEHWAWTRGRGIAHRDEHGRVVSLTGTQQDITQTRTAELALEDQVTQNLLMQAIASAANEARTLREALTQVRSLLLHDGWWSVRVFTPTPDGDGLEPWPPDPHEHPQDPVFAEEATLERTLAERTFARHDVVWDADGLCVAFPVVYGGQVRAVITAASQAPLWRQDVVEGFVRQAALQLARVVERELAEHELAAARDAAMEASRQKSEFLARMSHEIRTPLNAVIGLNELLLRTDMSAEQLRLASGVRAASRSLLDLINDVLDFSKIEAGMLKLERVAFDVRDVLAQTLAVIEESADARKVALMVECDDSVPTLVVGDPVRLGQVLTNLGSNAVKFTPEGRVHVRATATRTTGEVLLRVEVTDTGIGIEGLDSERLFESFHQADASITRVHGGTGLGLAISRELVEAMGGEIGARPRAGGGSLFWFTIRLGDEKEAVGPVPHWQAPQEPSPTAPALAGRRRRILVVEDNPVNQMVAVGLLHGLGYEVDTADDGTAGLEALAQGSYDLVLMDVQMPRMDGYTATRELRRREEPGQRLPVLAMTAAAIQGERERCLAAGMDDFLTKPVHPDALGKAIAHWLGTAAAPPPAPRTAATPQTGAAAAGLDRERLDLLRDMADGDTSYLDRAIDNFLANTPGLVEAIELAVRTNDAEDLVQQAHRLAGSALNLGVPRVGASARALEHLGDSGTTQGASGLLARLREVVEADCASLADYRTEYRSAAGE